MNKFSKMMCLTLKVVEEGTSENPRGNFRPRNGTRRRSKKTWGRKYPTKQMGRTAKLSLTTEKERQWKKSRAAFRIGMQWPMVKHAKPRLEAHDKLKMGKEIWFLGKRRPRVAAS